MPEMLEVELYRRSIEPLVGRRITAVEAPDALWARHAPGLTEVLTGRRLVSVRRHGKVLLLDTDGPVVGLRFGMTGRLVVDGSSGVDGLVYGAHGDRPEWIRLVLRLGRVRVEVSDPRRLGSVALDPDLGRLGPDAWAVGADVLRARLGHLSAPVKAALLDQHRLAGLGNMLADEVLLRSGIAPGRPCRTLTGADWEALADAIGVALPEMLAAGGSHAGSLSAELRRAGAPCPRDGRPLVRTVIGGRSSYSCPVHQL